MTTSNLEPSRRIAFMAATAITALAVSACGGDTSGDDHVRCTCLGFFGLFNYTADTCTIDDLPPEHPGYPGSTAHNACVNACGETLGPLFFLAASPWHHNLGDYSCRPSSSTSRPLLGADGPDAINYTYLPSRSRLILRRPGMFGFFDVESAELSVDAPMGMDHGVGGNPVTIRRIRLQAEFPVPFDGHNLTDLAITLYDGFIESSTNGRVGVDHVNQVNGVTIAAGQAVQFSGKIDGVVRNMVAKTTSEQSFSVLRYGSPGAYTWRAHYAGVLEVPNTNYEVVLDLYFDAPLDVATVIEAVIPKYILPTETLLVPKVERASVFRWFNPISGKIISQEENPVFNMETLGIDCVVLWAFDKDGRFGQDQFVCLHEQGCSAKCMDLSGARATCADGTVEDDFGGMVGCAGSESFVKGDALCGAGSRLCSAAEWVDLSGGQAPSHNYWTRDPLKYYGNSAACGVSLSNGYDCGADTPMRVCTETGVDPSYPANTCGWENCGLDSTVGNDYFGGCAGQTVAGALCCAN